MPTGPADDPALLRDLIEERAAILEFGAGLPRAEAENTAAQMHGFTDWNAAQAALQRTPS